MARKGLISKIISSIIHVTEEDKEQVQQSAKVPERVVDEVQFVIPSDETLSLIEDRKPLSVWQINEVLSYIKSNYYFCEDKRILNNFALEWTMCEGDTDVILEHISAACSSIVSDLSSGRRINPKDALWVSYNIYADDSNFDKKRIISKKLEAGCVVFEVTSQDQNSQIAPNINKLKKQLNVNKYTKTFANTL